MATRPVFTVLEEYPYYKEITVDFTFYSGFSLEQKQKSIKSLHNCFLAEYPYFNILEISTKSEQLVGIQLSAFNLLLADEELSGIYRIENIFQSSKVFKNGGPYRDLLYKLPGDAKKDDRLRSSGDLIEFMHGKDIWPIEPKTMFYDWLYMSALHQKALLSKQIVKYNAFTDIEFNPKKSINCQARTAAIYVSLNQLGLLEDALSGIDGMKKIYTNSQISEQLSFFNN